MTLFVHKIYTAHDNIWISYLLGSGLPNTGL